MLVTFVVQRCKALTAMTEPNLHRIFRTLDPTIQFADIDIKSHTAKLWATNGSHILSWSTLPWAAEGVAQILLRPALTANKVVPIRAFEASQADIVAALERLQGAKYSILHFENPATLVPKAQQAWRDSNNRDTEAALLLVKAGFFLDGYGSDFVHEPTAELGNEYLELPELKFEDVVEQAVKQWA